MIKRLLWLLVFVVCAVPYANAQQGLQGYVVTGTGAQARIVLTGSAIVFHQLTWNVTGTVSSCTVALDTSVDGVSWSAGNAIAGQTCTSNGQSALSTSAVFNFVRVNTTAFSGTGSVVITWAGYVATPGGLPSGCTSPGTGAITCTGTVAANALTSTTSLSTGSGASACGAATSCSAGVEAATACTPTVGQICKRYDSVTNNSVTSANGAAEVPDLLLTAAPVGSKCLQTSGTSGGVTEAANACGTGVISGLTTGSLPKAASATSIANSLCDEGITTANALTCTNTAGVRAPAFTSTGTTSGFVDYPQGSDSGAIAPCNAATSICWEAPTSVTSYKGILPGAAATGIPHYANSANVITETISAITPADATGNTSGSGNFCLVTNCSMTTPALGTPSAIVLTNATGFPAAIVQTGQTNVYGAFLQDFTAGTMEIPEAAGFTTNVNSTIGLDTTNNNVHEFVNGADSFSVVEAAAIVANTILKATDSTHSLVTASSMIDNGTSVTSTDTGGYVAPVFVSNGTTAGFVDYPQGSTSAAVAPCNTATSICRQAPASVTSYLLNLAAAAPVNNNSAEIFSNANPGVGSFAKIPQLGLLTADYTNATTGFTSLPNLAFSVEANTNYHMHCNLIWSASAATAGPQYQITGPASPTAVVIQMDSAITGTTAAAAAVTAFSSAMNPVGAIVVTATNEYSVVDMDLRNGANAGTVQVQAAAQGTGTLTIRNASGCQLQ